MPLKKDNVNINFGQGLDTKTDPKQIQLGKFSFLSNSVFNKGGLLTKRNGFGSLTTLVANNLNTLTTFNGNLTAIGENLYAFSQDSEQWINKGTIKSVQLSTIALVRSSTAQNTIDVAVTSEGLTCVVWEDSSTNTNYEIIDSITGQVIVASTTLPSGAKLPRVFLLGNYFVITFLITVTATPHLQYIAISINNVNSVSAATDISTQVSSTSAGYDGQIVSDRLYLAWNGSDGGGAVRITYITNTLSQGITATIAGKNCVVVSITGDISTGSPRIWVSFKDSSNNGWTHAYTAQLASLSSTIAVWSTINAINLTSLATNGVLTIFYQTSNTYSFSSVRTDYISSKTVTNAGTVGSAIVVERSVALASKAFFINNIMYMLVTYGGTYQPTYFLIDSIGNVIAKLAYSNGGGYPSDQILSNAIVNGQSVSIGYRFKDQLTAVNKEQTGSVGGIYSQTGLNLATFTISNAPMVTSEIGGSLHLASGFLWMYDGVKPVEHGFHVWPEDLLATNASTGGNLSAQIYFYQVTYEWTDSQGNIHRSAPSLPLEVDLSASMTSTNEVVLNIPTLRLTYKTAPNSIRLMVWRWSTAQPLYYQVTSIASPTLNDPTVDSVAYTDTQADSSIVGNALIYTTGGVIENIGAPSSQAITLYKTRLMLLDAEDPNLVWFSKQVIENTPVEMSDLLTTFIPPTTGAQGSTGPNKVLSAMDDKFILFKTDAIYYMTGTGPDNTGAQNDFSDPIFITSTVGCNNPQSLVFIPQGLLFQSDKGIWLLGRDLSTNYIGAPVEDFTLNATVLNAVSVPGTNQVRFTMSSGITLMYDYYYAQWGSFSNIPGISSTLYQGMHTYLNEFGQIRQETLGTYLDGSQPVLMSFVTGWFNLAGLQGYQRAYYFYLLGQFLTPHKLQLQIAYDYYPYPSQSSIITPDNFSPAYGGDSLYGSSSPYGGPSGVEQWRIFLQQQKCEAFQIYFNEIYDPSYEIPAGAGLTVSGLDLVIGIKGTYPRLNPSRSVG